MEKKGKLFHLFLLLMLLLSIVGCNNEKEKSTGKEENNGAVGLGDTEEVYQFNLDKVREELVKNLDENDEPIILFGGITPLGNGNYLAMFGVGYRQGFAIAQLDKDGKVVQHDFFKGYCSDFHGCIEEGMANFPQTVITEDKIIYFGPAHPAEPILMYDRNTGNKIGKISGDFSAIQTSSYVSHGFVTDQYIYAFISQYLCCDNPITQENTQSYLLKIDIKTGELSWSALIRAGIPKDALFDVYGIIPAADENYFYIYGRLFEQSVELPGYSDTTDTYAEDEPFNLIIAKYNIDGYFQSKIIYRFDDGSIGGIRKDGAIEKNDVLYVINYTNSCVEEEKENNPSCLVDMKTVITRLRVDEQFSVEIVQEDLEFETYREYDAWFTNSFVYDNVVYLTNDTEVLSLDLGSGDSNRIHLPEYGVYSDDYNGQRVLKYYFYEGDLYYVIIDGAGQNISIFRAPLK